MDKWKLIRFSNGDANMMYKDELYNLEKDPQESVNLAKEQIERVRSMNQIVQEIID